MNEGKRGRRRRSSSLIYQEPPESIEHMSDQSGLPNLNANWVNSKGMTFSFSRGSVGIRFVRETYVIKARMGAGCGLLQSPLTLGIVVNIGMNCLELEEIG